MLELPTLKHFGQGGAFAKHDRTFRSEVADSALPGHLADAARRLIIGAAQLAARSIAHDQGKVGRGVHRAGEYSLLRRARGGQARSPQTVAGQIGDGQTGKGAGRCRQNVFGVHPGKQGFARPRGEHRGVGVVNRTLARVVGSAGR